MDSRQIYLIRHAETAWSLSGQHTGLTDIPLTEKGREEAKQLQPYLAHHSFEKIFVSPLKRALETCALAGFNEATIDPDLVEWNYGDYEGLTSNEILQQNPDWNIFTQGAPGGESVEEIGMRADRFWQRLKTIEGDIAIFSSGHISRVLTARWLGLPASDGKLFVLSPASPSILGYERETPVIICWNCHLV